MLIRPKLLLTYSSGVLAIALLIAGLCQTFLNRNTDNEVTTFYFTVHTTTLSYEEVKADYATAAARLQAEFTNALGGHITISSNDRRKREAMADGPEVTVIGISENGTDGVAVLSGVAYPRSLAPSTAELTQKINNIPNTVVVQTFSTGGGDFTVPTEAFCSPTASGTASTTIKPDELTTCPSCPTPECPPQMSCPPCSSSPSPTAIVTATEHPSTTQSTPADLPCKVDIFLVLTMSREAGRTNVNKQLEFVNQKLAPTWPIKPEATEVHVVGSGSIAFYTFSRCYNYENNTVFYKDVDSLKSRQILNHESIFHAITKVEYDKKYRRPGVKHATVVFTYYTSQQDVKNAAQYVGVVHASNTNLVLVGVGPLVDLEMLNALRSFIVGADILDNDTVEKINAAICASGPPPPFQYPTNSPRPTLPTTTLATMFGRLPCTADIVIATDQSHALTYEQYDQEMLFVRDKLVPHWTINPNETEVAVFGYGLLGYTCYKRYFNYNNNSEVFADITKMKEEDLFNNPDFGIAIVQASYFRWKRNSSVYVTILFTYTSSISDRKLTDYSVNELITPGKKFIIVAMGGNYDESVLRRYTNNLIKATKYTDALADQLNEEICRDVSPPPASTTASFSSTTAGLN